MAKGKGDMPRWEKWLFASGDIYGGGAQSILSVLYLIFLTNILHINPAWAGAVVMVSKILGRGFGPNDGRHL